MSQGEVEGYERLEMIDDDDVFNNYRHRFSKKPKVLFTRTS